MVWPHGSSCGSASGRAPASTSWSIVLTAAGAEARDRAVDLGNRHTERVFAELDPSERDTLTRLLLRLVPQGHFTELFRPP